MSGNLVKMTPEQRREHKMQGKKRAAQVGLANNAFGAAAGAAGTKLAWDVAREEVRAHNAKAKGIAYTPKVRQTVTQRALGKLKLRPKQAVLAAGTVAVGSQLLNGAMDAQSASYFGQELKNMRSKQVGKADLSLTDVFVSKSAQDTGVGHSLVAKKIRRFDPEGDRQRRLGVYEGAGAAGAAAGLGAGGTMAYRRGRKTGELLKLTPAQLKKLKLGAKAQGVPGALLAGGTGLAALGVAAHRRANSARNERWN